jgi:hypothetical protein
MLGVTTQEIKEIQQADMYYDACGKNQMLQQRFIGYMVACAESDGNPNNIFFAYIKNEMAEAYKNFQYELMLAHGRASIVAEVAQVELVA